ncbi:MAG: hypothetical protein SGI89_03845 [bacterium]|nr:hypothetical protein [bacterium]
MKTKYNTEDLVHSLPDYISDKISDDALITAIESEIENNSEFKSEYDDLKKTFNFLKTAELEGPNENYFNNLSVKINQRIDNENVVGSFWQRLSPVWKILLPAIPIIIAALILFNVFRNETTETKTTGNEIQTTPPAEKKVEAVSPKEELKDNSLTKSETQVNESPVMTGKTYSSKEKDTKSLQANNDLTTDRSSGIGLRGSGVDLKSISQNLNQNVLADNIESTDNNDEMLYPAESDEETLEQDFYDLTPQQQKEILDDLKNTQI